MTDTEQSKKAKDFADKWAGRGYEKGDSQPFWLSLLRDVFGIENPTEWISFEEQVHLDHTSFIDAFIPTTKILIEQKSLGKDLNKPIKQSDGSLLSPFQQAKRYITELPLSKHPRWVVTCNFEEFYVYDMERPHGEPEKILLADLSKEYYRLRFLVDTKSEELKRELDISLAAGDMVGLIYDALYKQYQQPVTEQSLKDLNVLCVRIVFCLYAEDAGIFGRRGMFHDYLSAFDAHHTRKALIELFRVLDTPPDKRDAYLEEELAEFPYVNGGLFSREDVVIPQITEEIRDCILKKASEDFDWSQISPTIFGAIFESTLNPETRRKGGMHYTSIENIHKLIDPLFLDDLTKELESVKQIAAFKTKQQRLRDFQSKLASLTFLDPACGSGNFLTETYLCLRRLENQVIDILYGKQIAFDTDVGSPIQVSIHQFYGIEINDFAVTVAKTALWIAESQMMEETRRILQVNMDFLPLKTNASIVEGNALRIDWEDVIPKNQLNFIMGNPPFVGYTLQSDSQKEDIQSIYIDDRGKPYKAAKKIDYVACWYFRAAQYIQNTNIKIAYVSTNSITQGEQVGAIWKPLYERFHIHIDFAYRTFQWDSEASIKAHVHCVIIGFSTIPSTSNKLYTGDSWQFAENINAYLMDAPNIFIESRKIPLGTVPDMLKGSQPTDGGNLLFDSREEMQDFIRNEPLAKKWIRPFVGAEEYINRKERYCLWLVDATPAEMRSCPTVMKRILAVKEMRLNSPKEATNKWADKPYLFTEIRQPDSDYIIVPSTSSERRKYIPIGFMPADVICGNANLMIPNATLFHFGVLTSNVHMAWVRAFCGRLESRYRYSADIVYNNFPWVTPTDEQKAVIEQTARAILDARALYPDSSLADLYDENTMPKELLKAHQNNDRAVMKLYGLSVKDTTESSCVAALMQLYQQKIKAVETAIRKCRKSSS